MKDPSPSPWNGGGDCSGKALGLNKCDAAGAQKHLHRVEQARDIIILSRLCRLPPQQAALAWP